MRRPIILFAALLAGSIRVLAGTYSLDSCIAMALRNNAQVQSARIDMLMADEDRKAAFTKYFPTVKLNGFGFISARHLISTEVPLTSTTVELPQELQDLGLDISADINMSYGLNVLRQGTLAAATAIQPLFAGGRIVNGNKLAALQQEVRELQYSMTETEVRQNVTEYYWSMVSVGTNLKTLDAADNQLDTIHSLVSQYVDAGVISRSDLLTVELKQQENESLRLQVTNGLELLRMVLAQLAGADMDDFQIELPDSINIDSTPEMWFTDPADAAAMRSELVLASKGVEAEELQMKMERGKYLPTVGIGAAGYHAYIDVQGGFEKYNQANIIGLATVSIPLTDWWEGSHNIKKAKLSKQKAELVREDAAKQLQLDIRKSWNELTEAYAQIGIAEKSVVSAEENLRMATEQFQAGTETVMVLLDAYTLSVQAQSNLAQAKAKYCSCLSAYKNKTNRN